MRARGPRQICITVIASACAALSAAIVRQAASAEPPANYTGQSA
jgi:hypothetical protein